MIPAQVARGVAVLVASMSLCQAQPAATNSIRVSTSNSVTVKPEISWADFERVKGFPTNLTTLDGKEYKAIVIRRLEADGIVIDYSLGKGGIGLTKLKFKNLPENLRKQWKYDAETASKFEAEQIQGAAEWRAKMIADEEVGRATKAARELAQLQADLAAAEAAMRAAEVRLKELEKQRQEAEIRELNWNILWLRQSIDSLKGSVDSAAWRNRY